MYKKMLAFLSLILVLSGCTATQGKPYECEFFAMDTIMSLSVYGSEAQDAALEAENEVYRLEKLLSTQLVGSEIARINNGETVSLSPETLEILECALRLNDETDGAFDISIYPVVQEWGFISGNYNVPSRERLDELLELAGADALSLENGAGSLNTKGAGLDLGAIAKGYASDAVAEILRGRGLSSAIISLGGNVYALGEKPGGKPWRVAISDPQDIAGVIGSIEVSDKAVVTSSGAQRFFERDGIRYHHIIDPKTGCPAESGLISVTIVCSSGMLADGLSTALFVMGMEDAAQLWRSGIYDFEAVLVEAGGQISVTQGLADSFSGNTFSIISE